MTALRVTPVILAGGKGTRLWPVSRTSMPKQFCQLNGEPSLFQQTVNRLCNDSIFNDPIILTSTDYHNLVLQQLSEIDHIAGHIICEPCGRDTAPAIALAALAGKKLEHNLLLVMPSDHKIKDGAHFIDAVRKSAGIAAEFGKIVTFGVKPTEPATGYGYLQAGPKLADGLGHSLSRFIEKPDEATAKVLLEDDNVYWNAGIFMFSPRTMCRELETHAPDLFSKVAKSVYACDVTQSPLLPDEISFSEISPISIDYAVMEHTKEAALVPVNPQWSDVGSWNAVWENSVRNEYGNSVFGDAICVDAENSFVSTDGPFIGVAGVSDLVVVANRDAVLVTSRQNCQSVKDLISQMKPEYDQLTATHAGETRPWGSFASLGKGSNHQVKTISVNPGGQLSLQYHFHRAEHWIVVAGSPTVTVGENVMQLTPCQQVFIPQGAVHRLENHTEEEVQIIEVQYGSYFGEDDIVRLSDVYGRPEMERSTSQRNVA